MFSGIRTLSDQITILKNDREFDVQELEEGDGEPSHDELRDIMINTGKSYLIIAIKLMSPEFVGGVLGTFR